MFFLYVHFQYINAIKLWWRHNTRSEKPDLGDNGEIIDRYLFLAELSAQNIN